MLAALLDARSLDRWCREYVAANTHGVSLEEMRRELPQAPPEEVAALVERMNVPVRAFVQRLSDHIPGVQTVEELARLSSAEILVRILDANDPISEMNRVVASAYAEAGIERPALTIYERSARAFEIVHETRLAENKARVTFREEGAPEKVDGTWSVRRDTRGQWWLSMSAEVLYLPGGHVGYIDDPVVIAYMQRHAGQ